MKKTVLVTGATKGIGLAICQQLNNNFQVIGIARNPVATPFPGILFTADLGSVEDTDRVLKEINKQYKIDALVNNVGMAIRQPLGKIKLEDLQTIYEVNVRSTVQVTQAFLTNMKKNHWGRIINMSSRAIIGIKNLSSYSAAKSALIGLTKTWALELAEFNITVNAIAPGPIETELFRRGVPANSPQEKEVLSSLPLGRIGRPAEIACAVDFLLHDDAGFITGQTIHIDGGGSL